MNALGVAIIGAGAMGTVHARAFSRLDRVRIASVHDPDTSAADRLCEETGARRADSAEEAVADTDVSIVVVATPEHLHTEIVRHAVTAGRHVLVEKPFATDLDEALELQDLIQRADCTVMTGHSLRFEPRYRWAVSQVASGAIGELVSIRAARLRPRSLFDHYQRVHPALETAVHDVDVVLWVSSSKITEVYAVERSPLGRRNPDGIWATLTLENGAVASVETSFLLPEDGPTRHDVLEVNGTTGRISFTIPGSGLTLSSDEHLKSPDPILDLPDDAGVTITFARQAEEFVRRVRNGDGSDPVPLDDVVHGLAVVLAMIESARTGKPVVPRA